MNGRARSSGTKAAPKPSMAAVSIGTVESELALDPHSELPAILFELPGIQAARAFETLVYADFIGKILRCARRCVLLKRKCRDRSYQEGF